MTTIADVRGQLATIEDSLTGWRGSGYVGDTIDAPAFTTAMLAGDPRFNLGETKQIATFRCTAYVKRTDTIRNEKALDTLADIGGSTSTSFVAAVQASASWGSVTIEYAQVINIGEVALTQFGTDAAEYLARPFDVEVVW